MRGEADVVAERHEIYAQVAAEVIQGDALGEHGLLVFYVKALLQVGIEVHHAPGGIKTHDAAYGLLKHCSLTAAHQVLVVKHGLGVGNVVLQAEDEVYLAIIVAHRQQTHLCI